MGTGNKDGQSRSPIAARTVSTRGQSFNYVCVCKNCSVFQDMAAIAGLEMKEKEEVPIRSSSVWEVAV